MKNLIIIINVLFLTFISFNANAGFFGASNYEECMNDGKVGRTEQEMQVLDLKCQKQFPKLVKLYNGKNSKLHCVESYEKSILFFEVVGNVVNSAPQKLKVTTKANGTIYFGGVDATNSNIVINGSLNTLDGVMSLTTKNKSTNKDNWVKYFGCVEK